MMPERLLLHKPIPGDISLRYSFIWWGARSKSEVGYMGKKSDVSTLVRNLHPISIRLLNINGK